MNLENLTIEVGAPAPLKKEADPSYEAPAIESVLTPADLEREVHYAGIVAVSGAETNSAAG